ncbi:NADH-quinone oxidoreductase subunit L [Nocardioides dokdonensis FR1436]|uniref:NADH-quinone oxidoreductase subunit L n=1 Tax=Nocardioides dokdonensis FR1436 TaxID=1300347 RepID=A0A1A9GSK1_9ACTN|nr:proton-conducting transporter membrane subunit [Nocardioides dokdonensis]ANH40431.1 NADH-quinone oxidoreductase subunit L [Nocardioides dokdonensis FR1436]
MSAPDLLLVLVVVAPALVGALLVLAERGSLPHRSTAWTGVATLGLAALASVPAVLAGAEVGVGFVAGSRWGLEAAGPAVLLLPTVLVVVTLVLVVAGAAAETRQPRFTGLMLLFTAAAVLTVLSTSLPGLLVGWELMGAASYALIGYRYTDPHRVASGATAFLTTRAADLGLYLATAAALAGGTDLSLDALAGIDGGWRDVAAAGVLVAALGKAAQLPFSFWLARAMDGPSPVSALLHSAAMVALGGYLLLRLSPLLSATGWAGPTTAWIGVSTAVVLGGVAVTQTDLKLLLAASTSAQLGFVVLAAGVGATAAGTAHLVAHAAVKALLFLAAGAWLEALGSKRLDVLSGAARRWPALGALAVAALLALSGLPPLSLWGTKDAVLAGALEQSPALYAAGLAATVLAVAYAVVALVHLVGPPAPPERLPAPEDREEVASGSVATLVPVALAPLGVGAVALGVLALPPVLERLPGRVPAEPSLVELIGSSVLVVLVAVLTVVLVRAGGGTRRRPGGLVALLRAWLHLEPAVHLLVVRPTLRLAEGAARLDDRVLAPAVHGAAVAALRLARGAARADDRFLARAVDGVGTAGLDAAHASDRADVGVDRAVHSMAGALARVGRAVRRTSGTGQLHHYYLQQVGLLLLVLVVVSLIVLLGSSR